MRYSRFAIIAIGALLAVGLLSWSSAQNQGDTTSLKGKPAPDFELTTFGGETVKLSGQKGSVVLLDFWATWCPPCRESLPHVQKLADDKELAAKGLKVWAVNAREGKDKIEPFMKQNNYTFGVPMDSDGKVMKDYLVRGIPTTVVVGRDGSIKSVFIGFGGEESSKQIHKAVEDALAESGPAT